MTLPDMPPHALDAMRDLYLALDRDLASFDPSCRRCGNCCDFQRSGLTLFLGPLEAALFFQQSAPPSTTQTQVCPFFVTSLCANRSGRSIGCRTWFCDPASRDRLQALHETYLRLSRHLCLRHDIPWLYQPLDRWMDQLTRHNDAP